MDIQKIGERAKQIKAKDIMARFAITTKENETVMNLAHVMLRFKISGVPVIDRNGEVCGIITATDLFKLMKEITNDLDSKNELKFEQYKNLSVSNIMKRDVITISEETSLYEMIKIMCERNIHTLPVMVLSKKEIIGVIGRRDIINSFYMGLGHDLRKE